MKHLIDCSKLIVSQVELVILQHELYLVSLRSTDFRVQAVQIILLSQIKVRLSGIKEMS